jgi:hypothetical protein
VRRQAAGARQRGNDALHDRQEPRGQDGLAAVAFEHGVGPAPPRFADPAARPRAAESGPEAASGGEACQVAEERGDGRGGDEGHDRAARPRRQGAAEDDRGLPGHQEADEERALEVRAQCDAEADHWPGQAGQLEDEVAGHGRP